MTKAMLITKQGLCGEHLITTDFIAKDAIIFDFSQAQKLDKPTQQSIQINAHQHIIQDSLFLYLNHSCNPTVFVDTVALSIYALVDIYPQQELTFFYPATEWQMAEPFYCQCGDEHCLGVINGAANLCKTQLKRYKINPHIVAMLSHKLCT
jgi:hypothetical protein